MPTPITIISSMATRRLLTELTARYQQSSGQPVSCESVGGVDAAKRVQSGEAFDVVVLASDAIDQLVDTGRLLRGSRVDLVHSAVAVAVRAGVPAPDLSTEDAVRRAVLAARTLGCSTGPSGVQLAKLFERWGIAEAIRDRIVQAPPGVPVGRLVAEDQVELGFQQLSELRGLPGIAIAGPLPSPIQIITTFSGGVTLACRRPDEARALLAYLASPAAAELKRQQGMEPA